MYVCMYTCMYVCIDVCIYVCMYVCMHLCLYMEPKCSPVIERPLMVDRSIPYGEPIEQFIVPKAVICAVLSAYIKTNLCC